MVRRPTRGFTLVELLVVITIIGILMALLLPAVNFAVENARQRACMNNMQQLAKACVMFDSVKNRFPGYTNRQAYAGGMTTGYRQVSWFIEIAPQIERTDIYESFQTSATPPTPPYVDFAVCASDPPDSNDQPYLSYVGNAGNVGTATNVETIANGVMHNHFPNDDAMNPGKRGQAITATQFKDGLTNTLLISENIQATTYNATSKYANCFVWWETETPARRINGNKVAAAAGTNEAARPSSNHPGGVNVVFADGHTGWLREDIDYKVYVQLMTPRHGDSLVQTSMTVPADWKTYLLNEKDYK